MDEGVGQTGEKKGGYGAAAGRKGVRRPGTGFFEDLRIDLGEYAGKGKGDGEDSGQRRQPEHLQEQKGPEKLVDGAHEGTAPAHHPDMEDQGEAEPGDHGKRHPEEGEGKRLQKRLAQTVDGQEVRGDEAPGHALHLLPGIEGGHRKVGDGETE